MPLHPPPTALIPERLLAYGIAGASAGKSEIWSNLRYWYEVTNTPGHFYIISTEPEMAEAVAQGHLDGTPGNNFFSNATIGTATDYESLCKVSEDFKARATESFIETGEKRDWIITDNIGDPQTWARDVFFKANMGMSYREFINSGRKMKEVQPSDWGQMKGMYQEWLVSNIIEFPGHRMATAHAKEIRTDGAWGDKNPLILKTFGPYGFKPVGDDNLGSAFRTILLCERYGKIDWRYTTVDDNKRMMLERELVQDFVTTYLFQCAGWVVD